MTGFLNPALAPLLRLRRDTEAEERLADLRHKDEGIQAAIVFAVLRKHIKPYLLIVPNPIDLHTVAEEVIEALNNGGLKDPEPALVPVEPKGPDPVAIALPEPPSDDEGFGKVREPVG